MEAGGFVVCTIFTSALNIQNTAKLVPQQSGTTGTPLMSTANLQIEIWGCDLPPDVSFQDLQSWAAQTYKFTMDNTPTRWGVVGVHAFFGVFFFAFDWG